MHIVVGYHDNFDFIARENILSYFCALLHTAAAEFFVMLWNFMKSKIENEKHLYDRQKYLKLKYLFLQF